MRTGNRWKTRLGDIALIGAILLAAGTMAAVAESASLPVSVRLEEEQPLPPGAELEVELLDVSRADASSIRITSGRVAVSTLPVSLRLSYDPAAIDPRMTYVVAAVLRAGGRVSHRTMTAWPVLTRGAPERADIVLEQVAEAPPADAARISGVPWAVTEIGGRALVADDPPTIAFLEDGTFSMFGGCNRFRGRAALSAGRIAFVQPIAGTKMMCLSERMKLEQDMLEALDRTAGYKRSGARLSFTNAAGVVTVRFVERPEG